MELKAKDTYKVQYAYGLSAPGVQSLIQLYLPILRKDATVLYLFLASEAANTVRQPMQRILSVTDMDPVLLEKAVIRLEEVLLLRTYMRENDRGNSYIFELHSPMHSRDFFKSGVYRSRFVKAVGARAMETTRNLLEASSISVSGYTDITHPVSQWAKEDTAEEAYTEVRPRYAFSEDTSITFDYEHFIATTSPLVFPAELRTDENMSFIGKTATFYGLSADTMRVLVKRAVDVETMEFNKDSLLFYAENARPQEKEVKDRYALSPVSFLQSFQNGAPVTRAEKKILEHLSMDMGFSNEVINVMIEYILKVSSNRLNSKFVDSVAGEWARDGIRTKEQALAQRQKKLTETKKRRGDITIETPQWYREQKAGKAADSEPADDQLIREIEEMKNSMKGSGNDG